MKFTGQVKATVVYIGNRTKMALNWELKLFYITLSLGFGVAVPRRSGAEVEVSYYKV